LTDEAIVPLGLDTLDTAEGDTDHDWTMTAIDLRQRYLDEIENRIEEIYENYEPGGREWNELRKIGILPIESEIQDTPRPKSTISGAGSPSQP
jgi:hypothetical protein